MVVADFHPFQRVRMSYTVLQIIELQEASQIYQNAPNSLNDMNATVKTWRTRLPVISDNLSHWSDVFMWRQHHYQYITMHYDALKESGNTGNRSILGVHSSAQVISKNNRQKIIIGTALQKYLLIII